MAGPPRGNKNAVKGKMWADALKKALLQYESDGVERKQALFAIATKVVWKALEGDIVAIKEIGDRLDGKPAQTIMGDSDQPLTVVIVKHAED